MKGSSATSRLEGTRFGEVRWVDETGSTNADLLAAAAEGAPDGLVLVADHQTAGRGRLDRTWSAPAGASLLVSVLLRPTMAAGDAHLLTTAAGVAAVEACRQLDGITPGLKWPNDLVVLAGHRFAGRKLGGILAEARLKGPDVEAVVVGMGLNVEWPFDLPPELVDVAVALNHVSGRAIDREDLLVAWLTRLDAVLADLDEPDGRVRLLESVRRVSATIGRPVRAELPDGTAVEGTAVDVAANGHLVVSPSDGGPPLEIAVGDIVHLRQR
ncbi:biotin--[acetyl-CoA-carboxylase] ligase [Rhabdothermincola salaria]|uniref:biotin--[acetyl-CoA-carboxylase] ligase n=1 Tax=Rhabdothermincola salaria TaxID=2903142 RepID=UPI001E3817B3|nr:biotin--[acetyl-CoA-carboxylase] ligase [Rhabdothermincola salaria]